MADLQPRRNFVDEEIKKDIPEVQGEAEVGETKHSPFLTKRQSSRKKSSVMETVSSLLKPSRFVVVEYDAFMNKLKADEEASNKTQSIGKIQRRGTVKVGVIVI